jgi:putative ABC transport system substrate-binding protein
MRKTGHLHAGLRRRVGADATHRSTRRRLLIALGAAALGSPLTPHAQPATKVWRIGFLGSESASGYRTRVDALRAGLRDLGYVEGRNFVIEDRWAEGKYERLPHLAAELVNLKVDVIVTISTPTTRAAQKTTTLIPIVMVGAADPVGGGFVKSLARPEGNITGVSNMAEDLLTKRFELLLSMVPKVSRVAILMNPSNTANIKAPERIQAAAQKRGVKILPVRAQSPQELDDAFSLMVREKAGAVMVSADPFFAQESRRIVALALKNRLPSVYGRGEFVEAGGLMSYGDSITDSYRRAATYLDKIFKGAKPADLPVEQPMKIELFINGKTAKALGLKIPNSLLVSADKVIE